MSGPRATETLATLARIPYLNAAPFYVRWTAFPWNSFIHTTLGMSTGLSYATGISDFERAHSQLNPPNGTHVQHYFSPELTFALPEHKDDVRKADIQKAESEARIASAQMKLDQTTRR